MDRRKLISSVGMFAAWQALGTRVPTWAAATSGKGDYILRIEPCTLDIGPGATVKTLSYNGQVPGPLLRMREHVSFRLHPSRS